VPNNVDADRVQLIPNVSEAQLDGLNLLVKPEVFRDNPVLCLLYLLVDDDAFGVKVPDRVQLRIAENFWPTQVPRTPVAQGKLGTALFIRPFREFNGFQKIRTILNNPAVREDVNLVRRPISAAVWMTADRRRPFAESLVKMMNRKRFYLSSSDVAKELSICRNLNSALHQRKERRGSGQNDHVLIITQSKFV